MVIVVTMTFIILGGKGILQYIAHTLLCINEQITGIKTGKGFLLF